MATTADIKRGLCINYANDVYKIIEFQHVKPWEGACFCANETKRAYLRKGN